MVPYSPTQPSTRVATGVDTGERESSRLALLLAHAREIAVLGDELQQLLPVSHKKAQRVVVARDTVEAGGEELFDQRDGAPRALFVSDWLGGGRIALVGLAHAVRMMRMTLLRHLLAHHKELWKDEDHAIA